MTLVLPAPPGEKAARAERIADLDVLAPGVRERIETVRDRIAKRWGEAHRPLVWETLRTETRQAYLFGFGRYYDDGRGIVTRVQSAWYGWHRYGCAVDLIHPVTRWGATRAYFAAMGEEARRVGLVWGGDWNNNGEWEDESFFDGPHFQVGAPARRTPSDKARLIVEAEGLDALWHVLRVA